MARWRPPPRSTGRSPWRYVTGRDDPFSNTRRGEWWNIQHAVQAHWDQHSQDCARSCWQKGYWRHLRESCDVAAENVEVYRRLFVAFRKCYSARDLAKLPGVIRQHLWLARTAQSGDDFPTQRRATGRIGAAVCSTGGGPLSPAALDSTHPRCDLLVVRDDGSCDKVQENFGRAPSYLHGPLRYALQNDLAQTRERELPKYLARYPHRPELDPLLAETAGYSRAWRKSYLRSTIERPEALSPEDQVRKQQLWAEAYRWYLDQGLTQKQILSYFSRVWRAERAMDKAKWDSIARRERREATLRAKQHRHLARRAEALMRELRLGRALDRKQRRFIVNRWASEMRFTPQFKPLAWWFDPAKVAQAMAVRAPPKQLATRRRRAEEDAGGEED